MGVRDEMIRLLGEAGAKPVAGKYEMGPEAMRRFRALESRLKEQGDKEGLDLLRALIDALGL